MKSKSFGELWYNEDNSIRTINNSDEESSSSVDVSSEDEEELTDDFQFLPTTRQDLQKRFSELFDEFTRDKKY